MQTLTIRDLIDSNRKAIAENRLGALFPHEKTGGECVYRYPFGDRVGCAIGVGLTEETLRSVIADEKNEGESIYGISEFINFPNDLTKNLADILQRLHDQWTTRDQQYFPASLPYLPKLVTDWMEQRRNKPVTRDMFESYLDLLEQFA